MIINVYDKDNIGQDDLIGFCCIKVSALLINSNSENSASDWHSIFFNNSRAGLIHIESKFEGQTKVAEKTASIEDKFTSELEREKQLTNDLQKTSQENLDA